MFVICIETMSGLPLWITAESVHTWMSYNNVIFLLFVDYKLTYAMGLHKMVYLRPNLSNRINWHKCRKQGKTYFRMKFSFRTGLKPIQATIKMMQHQNWNLFIICFLRLPFNYSYKHDVFEYKYPAL